MVMAITCPSVTRRFSIPMADNGVLPSPVSLFATPPLPASPLLSVRWITTMPSSRPSLPEGDAGRCAELPDGASCGGEDAVSSTPSDSGSTPVRSAACTSSGSASSTTRAMASTTSTPATTKNGNRLPPMANSMPPKGAPAITPMEIPSAACGVRANTGWLSTSITPRRAHRTLPICAPRWSEYLPENSFDKCAMPATTLAEEATPAPRFRSQ